MFAAVEDGHIDGDVVMVESVEESDAVIDIDEVVIGGLEDEGGRSVGRDLQFVREKFYLLSRGVGAEESGARTHMGDFGVHADDRVDKDHKIGTEVDVVGVGDVGFVEVSAEGGGEMSAGREADDANAVGAEIPFIDVLADDTDGLLGILQRADGFVEHGGIAGKTVLDDEGGDAVILKKLRDGGALHGHGKTHVAAAGEDDDAGAVCFGFGRKKDLDGRAADFLDGAGGIGGFLIGRRSGVGDGCAGVEGEGLRGGREGVFEGLHEAVGRRGVLSARAGEDKEEG